MKNKMRIFFKILFLSLVGFSHAAVAQFISVPYTMSTPGGNVPMYHHVYMPTHYNNGKANPKFDFEVTFKNDSVVKLRSRILSEDKKLYMEQKDGKVKKKIFPQDTKSCLARLSSTFGLKFGIPADSCWLFKINVAAINCYSSIPSTDLNDAIAIQKGNEGKIATLNKENLEEMVSPGDEKLDKLIDKGKFAKAIEYYNDMNRSRTKK
jgi:hypothetical protein